MKKNCNKTIELGGAWIYKKDVYQQYQELCDRVFSKDAVKIAVTLVNNMTGLLRCAEDVNVTGCLFLPPDTVGDSFSYA